MKAKDTVVLRFGDLIRLTPEDPDRWMVFDTAPLEIRAWDGVSRKFNAAEWPRARKIGTVRRRAIKEKIYRLWLEACDLRDKLQDALFYDTFEAWQTAGNEISKGLIDDAQPLARLKEIAAELKLLSAKIPEHDSDDDFYPCRPIAIK